MDPPAFSNTFCRTERNMPSAVSFMLMGSRLRMRYGVCCLRHNQKGQLQIR